MRPNGSRTHIPRIVSLTLCHCTNYWVDAKLARFVSTKVVSPNCSSGNAGRLQFVSDCKHPTDKDVLRKVSMWTHPVPLSSFYLPCSVQPFIRTDRLASWSWRLGEPPSLFCLQLTVFRMATMQLVVLGCLKGVSDLVR